MKRKLKILRNVEVVDHRAPRRDFFPELESQIFRLLRKEKCMSLEKLVVEFQRQAVEAKRQASPGLVESAIKVAVITLRRKGLVEERRGLIEISVLGNTRPGATEQEIFDAFFGQNR